MPEPVREAPSAPAPVYSPALRALLPLLYVGWADRRLTRAEVSELRERAAAITWLTDAERARLFAWGNPADPPSRELHARWGTLLHEVASRADRETREDLAALGLSMARRALDDAPDASAAFAKTSPDEVLASLRALAAVLGPVDAATLDTLAPTPEDAPGRAPRYTFDVAAMRGLLDDEFPALRDRLRRLLSTGAFAYERSPVKEDHRARTFAQVKRLAEEELGALALPEEFGGGGDFAAYSAAFEMLGYHDGSVAIKFGVQFGLFAGSIANLGTEPHHRAYLAPAGRMELLGCFAMTETGHGSNVRGLETTITYLPGDDAFEVHSPHWGAGKEYIGNALDATLATVFGQLVVDGVDHGVHAVLVPLRDEQHALLPGVTVEDSGYKMGLNGVDNGRIWFDRVRVPRANLLNRFGDVDAAGRYASPIEKPGKRFFTMLGTLVGGRCCVPRAGLSAAKAGLAVAINYALRRRQFAPAPTLPETLLLDYPSHQRRLLPVLAKAYALDFALDWLNARYAARSPETLRELETQAAAMKAYATWFATDALQECREACGGKGYLLANRIGQRKGDTEIYTTFEGDNTVLCYLVARSLLTKFRQDFRDEGTFGVLRFVAGRVQDQFTQLNPVSVRNTDPNHLRSAEWQLDAMRFRENRMLYAVAQRIQRKVKGGMASAEAVTLVQPHLKALALAYSERVVLEQFVAAEEGLRGRADALAPVIADLRALYALSAVEADRAWWLEYDFLSSAKSKAVRREVDALCADVRPHAAGLVDAFGIPGPVLGAAVVG